MEVMSDVTAGHAEYVIIGRDNGRVSLPDCPVCGQQVVELVQLVRWRGFAAMSETVGYRLDPCAHRVTGFTWRLDADNRVRSWYGDPLDPVWCSSMEAARLLALLLPGWSSVDNGGGVYLLSPALRK